ncbi:hypothetical protein CLF_106561, partial [Clonorchis sinensis]
MESQLKNAVPSGTRLDSDHAMECAHLTVRFPSDPRKSTRGVSIHLLRNTTIAQQYLSELAQKRSTADQYCTGGETPVTHLVKPIGAIWNAEEVSTEWGMSTVIRISKKGTRMLCENRRGFILVVVASKNALRSYPANRPYPLVTYVLQETTLLIGRAMQDALDNELHNKLMEQENNSDILLLFNSISMVGFFQGLLTMLVNIEIQLLPRTVKRKHDLSLRDSHINLICHTTIRPNTASKIHKTLHNFECLSLNYFATKTHVKRTEPLDLTDGWRIINRVLESGMKACEREKGRE